MSFLTRRVAYNLSKCLRAPCTASLVLVPDIKCGRLRAHDLSWSRSKAWLRAVSSSPNETNNYTGRKTWKRRVLSTLDPDRLRSEDLMDVSGRLAVTVNFTSLANETPVSGAIPQLHYASISESGKRIGIPFPAGTHGFLYFRRSPHAHPAAGDIRFRLVRPESVHLSASERFLQGSDLLKKGGVSPWRIPLIRIFQKYPVVWRKLVEENLTSPDREAELESFLSNIPVIRSVTVLESIVDPFVLDLGNPHPRLVVLHIERIFFGQLNLLFACPAGHVIPRGLLSGTTSGKALVRFEVANLPCKKGSSNTTPKVVLRVLRMLEPPRPQDAEFASLIFKEGQLIQKYDFRTGATIGPWSTTRKGEDRFLLPSGRRLLEETYIRAANIS